MVRHAFRLLVFDWDGTLVDSEAHIVSCMQGACADLGIRVFEYNQVKNIIGLGLEEAIARLLPDEPAIFRRRFTNYYRERFFASVRAASTFFPGAEQTVASLREQGFLLGVATGKSRRGLDRALQCTGTQGLFHATRCADETRSKPDPEMLLQLMAELQVAPQETLMVGDTEYDMEMATNAGVPALAVSYGVHALERLQLHGPLGFLECIDALPSWLQAYSTPTAVGAQGVTTREGPCKAS